MARRPKQGQFPELSDIEREMSQVRSKGRYRRALRGTAGTVVVVAAVAVLIATLLLPVMRTKHQISTMLPMALLLPFPSRNVSRPTRNEMCRPDTATTCIKPDLLMVTYRASSA